MSFTVTWLPHVQDQLAKIWLDDDDHAGVSAAADRIDQVLAKDPSSVGEPRTARIRYLVINPLGVYYEVRMQDRLVQVRAVWRLPR
jgi:hypothetical protein